MGGSAGGFRKEEWEMKSEERGERSEERELRSVLEGRGKKVEGREYYEPNLFAAVLWVCKVISTLYLLPSTLQNTPHSSHFQLQQESGAGGILWVDHYYAVELLGYEAADVQTEAGALMEAVEL